MGKYFGPYGGQFVGEVLKGALAELEEAMQNILPSAAFQDSFRRLQETYIGRPTPLCRADNLSEDLGGAQVYFKLEGQAQTGAHKINNALGQVLLAKCMGKTRVIAETGAGQHGVATAAAAARLGLSCDIFMGTVDIRRQQPNVFLMKQYGAAVHPVEDGSRTLKDAVNAALKNWVEESSTTHYVLGSALGPYPYPDLVKHFQQVIGRETRQQVLHDAGRLPDMLVACCGGGSNAIGFFSPFLDDPVALIAVEAGGYGNRPGEHAVRMEGGGMPGIIEGYHSLFLQTEDGQTSATHSISAGLDYPGIGPELAYLGSTGRITFTRAGDREVLDAYGILARREGLICALESAHAVAAALKIAPTLGREALMVVNLSGRGDKDLFITAGELYRDAWREFLQQEAGRLADETH